LSRMIFFGAASLQHAVRQFMAHYHTERNHQGLENRLPQPAPVTALPHHPVQRRTTHVRARKRGAQISQHPEWTPLLFDDLGGAQRGDLTFSEASSAFSRANKKCRPRHER
jgi:hypothetical protein